ncbi:glycosyltransferase [Alteromonas sp. C1M14]|uniref:glycosyltransferase n=1 Tax=Alteromonas sp. C1M14 TaxID=2841567 RepID=UPI001C082911|nr:glycosyltransferase [Alteromonas sp. C1M14]MBU2979199.1 glycosyltransferase [Alteromonas sp. C1M14]
MDKFVGKLRKEWTDTLRYSPWVRKTFRKWFEFKGDRASTPERRLDYYFKAATSLLSPAEDTLSHKINKVIDEIPDLYRWTTARYREPQKVVSKGIIIKPWVSEQEKGVIYVSFEKHLIRLLNTPDFHALQKQFIIVFAPSWSPPHSPALFTMPRLLEEDGLFTTISNADDHAYMKGISARLKSLHLYASSWVNTDKFITRPNDQKDIDLLVIANYGSFKRHIALFKALAELDHPIKVTLIGQDEPGRCIKHIKREAALYGVKDMINFAGPQRYDQIVDYLARSKTSAIFSKREGSCVVVVESMAANVPVAVFKDAAIGSKEFINDQTGILLENNNVGAQLAQFVAQAHAFSPRQWLIDNEITYTGSVKYLNTALKSWHETNHKPWSRDILTLERSPLATIANPEELAVMEQEQQRVKKEFGLWIGRE